MAELSSINVTIGADTSRVDTATKSIVSSINSMVRKIGQANLEGVIKGDPLSAVNKSIREAQNVLKHYTSEWSGSLSNINQHLDKYTRASINNLQKVGTALDSVMTKQKLFSQTGAQGSLQQFQNQNINAEAFKKTGKASPTAYLRKDLLDTLRVLREKYPEVKKVIDIFLKGVESGTEKTKQEVKKDLEILYKGISSQAKIAEKELAGFGKRLQRATTQQGRIEFLGKLSAVKDETAALKRKDQALRESYITEAKARTEIALGINVAKNRLIVLRELEARQRLGVKLAKNQTIELKNLRKAYSSLNAASQGMQAQGGFLSPQWFKQRIGWFIQLRAFWMLYRTAGNAAKDLIEFDNQLARAMRTARSELMETTEIARQYTKAMGEAAAQHGIGFKESGEVLYQLGSAGLSAEEALSALNSTLSLIVGAEGDVRETTKTVAGIYNNFKDSIKGARTEQEKFQYINDLTAHTWKRHQMELNEYNEAVKRSAAMAKVAGVNLSELTALLAVAHDHQIRAGNSGRALVNVWMRMSRGGSEFLRAFNLEDTFDPSKPYEFMKVMDVLSKRMKKGTMTTYELSESFQRMGLRGAPIFTTLLKNWNEVTHAIEEQKDILGEVQVLEEDRLNHIGGAWSRFLGNMRAGLIDLKPVVDALTVSLNKLSSVMEQERIMNFAIDFESTEKNIEDVANLTEKQIARLEAIKNKKILFDINIFGQVAPTNKIKKNIDEILKLNKAIKQAKEEVTEWGEEADSRNKPIESNTINKDKQQKYKLSDLEKEIILKNESLSLDHRLNIAASQLSETNKIIADQRKRIAAEKSKPDTSFTNIQGMVEQLDKYIDRRKNIESNINKFIKEEIARKKALNEIEIKNLEGVLKTEEARGAEVSKILSIKNQIIDLKSKEIETEIALIEKTKGEKEQTAEILKLRSELAGLKVEKDINTDEIERKTNIYKDSIYQLNKEAKASHDIWVGYWKDTIGGSAHAVSGALTGLATGFPEQKQKAEELKVELDGLKKEYKEALGEGRIEDAKELKDQMGELKDNISDLEDPLKNVGNRFKEFFRGIIEKAQETIEELLAMELVTWAIGGSKEQGSIGQGSGLLGSIFSGVSGAVGSLFKGDGGITPSIKAFRSFSSGGLTGSPTMAFLGDNPSNKELVIPSENISTNRVEGYSREKSSEQPINIINVMTQEDVVQAMASVKGERLVVNMIGRDINSRGPIWKQIKST